METAGPEAEAASRARKTPVLWSGWWLAVCRNCVSQGSAPHPPTDVGAKESR
uniref:ASL1 fusion gene protein n=1 Tax=Mus musculus TaxID=10090 RepID=C6EQK0_MOUSE|nr:ASL1 fusion gene protein [Mus musculus]